MTINGGIDLGANRIKVLKDGLGVNMRFDPAMMGQLKRDGFDGMEFQIQTLVPIKDLYVFLGIGEAQERILLGSKM